MKRFFKKILITALLLGLNLIFYPYVEAANRFTSVSATLTRLKISTAANYTIQFTNTAAIDNGDAIVLTFASGFNLTTIVEDDVDIAGSTEGELTTAADCLGTEKASVAVSGQVMTFTLCAGDGGDFTSSETVTIEIGTHATASGTGTHQITNPSSAALYTIKVEAKTGATVDQDAYTAVYIIADDQVVLQATVDPILSFEILGGMASGTQANAIDFGTLEPNAYHKLLGAKPAYAGIKINANPANNETVTVRTSTYTFKSNQSDADDQSYYVFIGAATADTAENLYRAINNTDSSSVKANIDPGDSAQVWIVAVTAGTTGNTYAISDGTGGDVTLTQDPTPGTFVDGQAGSNYKDTNLGYGETDGTNMANEAWGTHLRISTNAAGGYSISVLDAGFTSGANSIADWSGTYGFGLWAKAMSPRYGIADPAANEIIADAYDVDTGANPGTLTTSAATLASYAGPAAGDIISIEYDVRISVDQPAGRYTDTITYIATSTY